MNDPTAIQEMFARHYFLFAFLASLGTMQISVTVSGARGLWLTPHRAITRGLGIGLIVAGIFIFFAQPLWSEGPWAAGTVGAESISREWGQADRAGLAGARNIVDFRGGLDGNDQAILFPLAAVLAFAVSALVGALNMRVFSSVEGPTDRPADHVDGIAGLAGRSYFSNLPVSWRNLRLEVADVWRAGLRSADRWSVFKLMSKRSLK